MQKSSKAGTAPRTASGLWRNARACQSLLACHRLVNQVAEGATISATLRQRYLDHLDRDQFLGGVDPEGRAPGAGPIEIADRARLRVAARRGTHREAEPEALAHRRSRRDIARHRQC